MAGDPREQWERAVAPQGFERDRRCRACYAIRLAESCRVAVERGFEYVSTTLAVSPYQLFDACEDELVSIAHAHGGRDRIGSGRERRGRGAQGACGCRHA